MLKIVFTSNFWGLSFLECLRRNVTYCCGLRNGCSYDYSEGPQMEGASNVFRIADMAFKDYGNMQGFCQLFDQGPVNGALADRFRGVSIHGGGDGCCSCLLGGAGFVEGSDIGQHRTAEVLTNARE